MSLAGQASCCPDQILYENLLLQWNLMISVIYQQNLVPFPLLDPLKVGPRTRGSHVDHLGISMTVKKHQKPYIYIYIFWHQNPRSHSARWSNFPVDSWIQLGPHRMMKSGQQIPQIQEAKGIYVFYRELESAWVLDLRIWVLDPELKF